MWSVLQTSAIVCCTAVTLSSARSLEPVASTVEQTASCPTVQPAPDWVCLNGGWLPPGYPIGTGAPVPPVDSPAPPASCQTVAPADNWVCANGGWVPPDHPLAIAARGTPPASCPTVAPGPDWV